MDILSFLQANSFLSSLVVGMLLSGVAIYVKFQKMGDKIHALHKRLSSVEEERVAHLESLAVAQGNSLSTIDERTKNMQVTLNRIENHLYEKVK